MFTSLGQLGRFLLGLLSISAGSKLPPAEHALKGIKSENIDLEHNDAATLKALENSIKSGFGEINPSLASFSFKD